jgi:hypothetical protein
VSNLLLFIYFECIFPSNDLLRHFMAPMTLSHFFCKVLPFHRRRLVALEGGREGRLEQGVGGDAAGEERNGGERGGPRWIGESSRKCHTHSHTHKKKKKPTQTQHT